MENRVRQSIGGAGYSAGRDFKLIGDGILTGLFAGAISIAYRWILAQAGGFSHKMYEAARENWLLAVCIFGALIGLAWLVGRLVKWAPLSSGSGIPQIQGEILGELDMQPWRVMTAKFLGGSLTNAAGLSLGREGPSIQLGGAMGKIVSRLLKRGTEEEKYLISAGAAAGLAAAFNAPISGLLFAAEELHKKISPKLLVPVFLASISADFISEKCFGMQPAFRFPLAEALPLEGYGWLILLGAACGGMGVVFNFCLLKGQELYKKMPIPEAFRLVPAFLAAGFLGLTFAQALGGGHDAIEHLAESRAPFWLLLVFLLLKLIFTAVSYGSAAQGGIFLPVLAIGGVTGAIVLEALAGFGWISAEYYVNFMVLGMAGVLCGVIRTPILSVLLVAEMTGVHFHAISLCVVVLTAYLTAEFFRSEPIYEALLKRLLALRQNEAERKR